jgi:hypothetical protein
MRWATEIGIGLAIAFWFCVPTVAQVSVSARVVDETGEAVTGARVELRTADGQVAAVASSDLAGNLNLNLPASGEYQIRAERLGFYVFQGKGQTFAEGPSQLTITLNHLQEFSDRIDVPASAPAIDPQQPADHKELDNKEIETIPYSAPQDYRSALPLMDGVVADNAGRSHFNGGSTSQTNYTLDGFNMSDPVTGELNARVNIETIQSMDLESSRFSAENGRGSSGVLDLKTKMGDDRWRFGSTNFIPGVSSEGGLHVNKWTPRLEVSGPLVKGRVWFHDGFDGFYYADVVHNLPRGQDRTHGVTTGNLSRFQANLTPANILTGSFLFNLADLNHNGLSFLNPAETTTNNRSQLYMSTLRDQAYFSGGTLVDVGFADSRGIVRNVPQGNSLFEMTPFGSRGNYFVNLDRHFYRQQWVSNLVLPTRHLLGAHQLKLGIDFEREAFHQTVLRHDYEILRADGSVARLVQFAGSPFQARKNFEAAEYIQDHWTPREGLVLEAGLRLEWNEIVRDLEAAPRFSIAWAPGFLRNTKVSAGWGVYYDAISLALFTRQQDQVSLSTFFLPGGAPAGQVQTSFLINERGLEAPYYNTSSVSVEHKLPSAFYLRAGYMRRVGSRGFTFLPAFPGAALAQAGVAQYALSNSSRNRYDAFDISIRHTFAGRFEWFAGYTRSSARSGAAVDYSLENPIFAPQMPGPYPWDTPNRVHMWGWAPLPGSLLPHSLRFLTNNTTAAYLVEYRTGFPFNVVDEDGFLVGRPDSSRLPGYFDINLHLERQFRALHYLWAWRFGFNNLTNNGNPNFVNNVMGTPVFLTYGRGQARAFAVRLRLLGRK